MAAALFAAGLFGFLLGGCRKKPADPIAGGTTTYVDPDAPKDLPAGELTEFSATLFLNNRWHGDEEHEFAFTVSPDESGSPVAAEANTGISAPADRALLDALAGIVARYDLASKNGLYDVTAGLPPEAWAYPFRASYSSGEEITFTVNNNPHSEWGEEVYDVFASWFDERGIDALRPETDATLITRFSLVITDGPKRVRYGGINVGEGDAIDGETYLLEKDAEGGGLFGMGSTKYILFPDDYYEKLTAIIASTDLDRRYRFSAYDHAENNYGNHEAGYFGWGDKTTADNEPDSDTRKLSLHLTFESGHRVNIDTRKLSEIDAMQSLVDALTAYLDPLFK